MTVFQPSTKAELLTAVNAWCNSNANALITYGDINTWDTSNITNMESLFNGKGNNRKYFNDDISGWDVSQVTNMDSMFSNTWEFNQDIGDWDVSSVTYMSYMFEKAIKFNQDISKWKVSKVSNMYAMFHGASVFNNGDAQDVSNKPLTWDVSKVTRMDHMFCDTNNFNQPIGNWNVSNVITMDRMFQNALVFNQDIGNWDVSKVSNMYGVFENTPVFNNGDAPGVSNTPLNWDVSSATSMSVMFHNAPVFNQDIGNWDVSKVSNMHGMLWSANAFNQTINIKLINADNKNYIAWDVSNVTDFSRMFESTQVFNNGDAPGVSNTPLIWDVFSAVDMWFMFLDAQAFNQDISGWDVTSVQQMDSMFKGAPEFNQNLQIWEVSTVTLNGISEVTKNMFKGAPKINPDGDLDWPSVVTYFNQPINHNISPTGYISITGSVIIGEELSVNTSTLIDRNGLPNPSTFTYQWHRTNTDGITANINGATQSTYTSTSSDFRTNIGVTVTYTDGMGTVESVESIKTSMITVDNISPTGTVTITGTVTEGEILTAENDLVDPNGPNTLICSYQWNRTNNGNTENISGATQSTHTLTSDDVGSKIGVTATYTDDAGYLTTVESSKTITSVRAYNRVPTGSVTITGTVTEGEILTAENDLVDLNGPDSLICSYQWHRTNNGITENIDGADQITYTLTSDDVGSKIGVTVTYTDDADYLTTVESSKTITSVRAYNRVPTGSVTITGTVTEGEILTAENDLVDLNGLPVPSTFTYQWHRTNNGTTENISGATQSTHTLTYDDVGSKIGVTVTYTDDADYLETVESSKTLTSVIEYNRVPTGTVLISGIPIDGQELSVDTSEIVDLNGPAVIIFSYQWHSTINGTKMNINGETNSTYTLTSSEIGKSIGVTVTYTDDADYEEEIESIQTDTIIAINSDPTGDVTITGTITDGEVLDVDTSNLVDLNGLPDGITNHFSYQWHRILGDGTKSIISNVTTTSTYTLIPADVGKQIEVTVIYTDGDGYPQTVESIKTVPVREANVLPTGTTTILGSLYIGNTLTVNNDIVDENGLPNSSTFIYQWKRTISGTTTNVSNEDTYLLGLDDVGSTMTVSVSYTDQALYQENVISAPTGEILRFKPVNRDALKTAFNLASSNSANALLQYGEVNLWDTSLITDMNNLYYYNNSFALGWGWFNPDISNWDVSNVTNMRYMFYSSKGFNININGWDVSKVKDMYQMFGSCTWFNQPLDEWDVSQVTDMRNMFSYATDFNQNLRDWDVQPNTTLYYMFNGATRMTNNHATANTPIYSYFKQIFKPDTKDKLKVAIGYWDSINAYTVSNYKDITTWDTSLLTDISWLFADNTTFNGDISGWDVSNVTNMTKTFYKSTNFNKPIGNWDVSKVTRMFEMFHSCTWFNQPLDEWDVSKVTDMRYMYQNATAFDQPIKYWTPKTSGIMFYNMFLGATKMNDNHFAPSTPTSTGFFHKSRNVAPSGTVTITGVTREKMELTVNTSGLVDQNGHGTFTLPNGVSTTYTYQWHRTSNGTTTNIGEPTSSPTYTLVQADVGHTIGVKVIYIDHDVHHQNFESQLTVVIDPFNLVRDINSAVTLWFNNNSTALSTYGVIDGWDTSLITDMGTLFKDKASFNSDIGGWNVANVTNMESMFDNANAFNQPIGNWDVSNVTNMQSMFYHAHEFDQPIGNWNVSNVTNMYRMFLRAQDFNKPIGNWNVANVTNMESMFDNANAFNQNIGDWNVSNVTNMYRMFLHVQDFNQPIGNWNVSNVTNMEWMLCGAQVFNKPIGNWNVTNVTNMNHMFELASKFNQDISSWDVSNVNNMNKMFFNASDFDQFIRQWEVGTNTSTVSMFQGATKMINNQQASVSPARSPIDYFNVPDNYPLDASAEVTISDLFPAQGYPLSAATNFDGLDNNGVPDSSTYTFQWHRTKDGTTTDIPGATAPTHTLTNDEVGFTITVTASYTDLHGYQESKTSDIATGEVIKFKPNTREQLKEAVDLWISNNTNAQTTYGDINTEWNTSLVEDMSELFQGKTSFNDDISNWNVSNVTTMNSMFDNAKAFNQNIGGWNTSKVTNMDSLFYTAEAFNQNIGSWNVSKVTTMSNMFKNTNNFDQPIGNWDVSKVTNMTSIFHGAQVFNQEIDNWNVSNVTSMTSMFNEAQDFNKPIGNWDVKNVTTLESMFQKAKQFNQDIGNWNLAGVTNMTSMFNEAEKFDKDISTKPSVTMNGTTYSAWDVSGVTSMYLMFSTAKVFNQNIGNWDVSNVTNMALMFYNANAFNQDIGNWVVSNVTNMAYMFNSANVFDQNIRDWNVQVGTDLTDMFSDLMISNRYAQETPTYHYFGLKFKPADRDELKTAVNLWISNKTSALSTYGLIGYWDTSSVTDMSTMFNNKTTFNDDISGWDVSNVTNMYGMFLYAYTFNKPIGNWNVSNVTNMQSMFQHNGATSHFNQDISGWDVKNVKNMTNMFYSAETFDQNLISWNVSNVTTMHGMFPLLFNNGDSSAPWNWNVSNVTSMECMFQHDTGTSNFNQDISGWDVKNVKNMTNMFYSAETFDQNLISWNVQNGTNLTNMFQYASKMLNSTNIEIEIKNTQGVSSTDERTQSYLATPNYKMFHSTFANTTFKPADRDELKNAVDEWCGDATQQEYAQRNYRDISTWDTSLITDMSTLFNNKTTFNDDISGWDVSNVTNMYGMFLYAYTFNKPIGNWNVSNVTNMQSMFQHNGATSHFNQDISGWDVKNVKNMTNMFYSAETFDQNLISWNVSNVTTMHGMFQYALLFNNGDSSAPWNWNVSNVTSMECMFQHDTGTSHFNQDISGWNVSNVNTMLNMFYHAIVFDQNIREWDVQPTWTDEQGTEQNTNLSNMFAGTNAMNANVGRSAHSPTPVYSYFKQRFKPTSKTLLGNAVNQWCLGGSSSNRPYALSNYGDISGWDTSLITDMSNLFNSKTTFNDDISGWDVSNVTNMYGMFLYAYTFNKPIGNWNVSNVTNMQSMFQHNGASSHFNQDISGWNVSNVNTMLNMFYHAIVFDQNIRDWDVQPTWTDEQGTEQNTNLSNMFAGTNAMNANVGRSAHSPTPVYSYFKQRFKPTSKTLLGNAVNQWCLGSNSSNRPYALSNYRDISTWDTSLIEDMSNLFDGKTTFNDDISGWDVSKVENMKSMFSYAEAFNQPIGNWDVSNVTNMYCMFVDAQDFNQPIGNWDVTKVTDMQSVFYEAQAFNQPIGNWDVSNVTTMYRMFYKAQALDQNIRAWDVSSVNTFSDMFHSATKMNSERGAPFTPSASYFVNRSPTFNDATVTVAEHSTYTYNTYNIIASDQDGDICTITAETKPDWMTFTDNGDSTASLTGVAPSSAVGTPQSVSLRANDGYGKITDNNFDVIVSNVPVTLSAIVSSTLKHSHLLTNGSPALVTANVSEDNASLEIETATLNYDKMVGGSSVNVSIDVKSHLELSNSVVKVKTGEHANLLALIQEHAGYNLKVNVKVKAIDAGDANIIVITPNVMVSVVEDPPIVTVSDPLTIDERAQTPVKSNDQDAQIVFSEACSATLNNTTNFELVTTDNITYTLKFKSGQHDTTTPGDYSLIVTGTSIANTMQVTSSFTITVLNINEVPTGTVTISGTAKQGETLTASNNLADVDGMGAITYQWSNGKTGTSITLEQADVGSTITVTASYTDNQGTVESETSSATSVVVKANDPPTGTVTISGTATEGETLTASNNLADVDGMGAITYQWSNGKTGSTITLEQADVGSTITVTASYTDNQGTVESETSSATSAIAKRIFQPQSKSELSTAIDLWVNNNASALSTHGEINTWDTSLITDMRNLFYRSPPLNFNSDIGNWNTSSVTDMFGMFYNCDNFNQNISQKEVSAEDSSTGIAYTAWDTGLVTSMNQMFGAHDNFNNGEAAGLSNKPLNWNTSNVINMYRMFYYANAFNQDIGNWNTSKVETMKDMFRNTNAFNRDIGNWNTSNVANMYGVFFDANAFNKPIGNWNTSNVTDMSHMLRSTNAFNQDIGNWNTSKVTSMYCMFYYANKFNQDISRKAVSAENSSTGIAYTAWDTPDLTSLAYFLAYAKDFNNDSFGNWDLSNVTDITNALINTNLSAETYSNFLISLATSNVQSDLTLKFVPSIRLDTANQAHTTLTSDKNMTIYDGDSYTAEELIAFQQDEPYMIELNSDTSGTTHTLTDNNMPIHITDSGGVRDPYQTGENYNLHLTGNRPFTLVGTSSMYAGNDSFKIYDGSDDSANLLFTSSLNVIEPINVQSGGSNIYITFTSAAYVTQAGFHLTVNYVNTSPTGTVTISGTAKQGETLTASNNLADVDGMGAITYQWSNGKTGSTITLEQADVGSTITVTASYTDGEGTVESETSTVTSVVVKANDPPTGTVTISGTAKQGETLTASNNLADVDGMGAITYQWSNGKTGSTITLEQADVGSTITVTASYTDGEGTVESETSTVTSVVVKANDPPTGTVTISGTAKQGETLTASNNLADVDGMGAITYQWSNGKTGSTITLEQADVGSTITVTASYTDGEGTVESETSTVTSVVVKANDPPTGTVTISGTAKQGETLTASNNLADVDGMGAITYQWSNGKTGSTITLEQADVGSTITVTASYTDGEGTVESETSTVTSVVVKANDPPTGTVTISGTAKQGETLTASNNLADVDGMGAITYQWSNGKTGTSITLEQADVGSTITVTASYTDNQGTVESETSSVTSVVVKANDPPTGTVTISGTATEGETLTASNNLADVDGMGAITYQWKRGGVAIGTDSNTYILVQSDIGSTITVTASYTDGEGTQESVISEETSTVAIFVLTNENIQSTIDFWISDNAEALTRYGNISGWDTSVITNMKNLFKNKKSFNDDISAWDVSSVTDMEQMFKNARLFNQPISNWNISNVTNISYMLQNAQAFNQPITTWNLSSVTNMDGLFANAYAYKRAHPGVENTPIKEFFPYAGAGSLEITGTLKETEILTADINILNSAAQVQTYQWKRNNMNIGTNSAQYTLTSADVGNLISLSVQLTDDSVITGKTLSKVLSGSSTLRIETKSIRNKPKPVKDVNNRRNVTKELFVQKTNDVALMNSQQKRDLVKSNVTALFKEYPGETDFVVPMATILESLPIPVKSTKTKRVKLFDASSAPLTIDLTIDLTNLTQEEAAEATEAALEEALYIDTSVNIPVTLTFTNDTVIITQTSETEFEVDHNGVITVQNVGERVLLPNSNKVVTLGSITGENNEAPTFNVAPDTVAEGSTYTYDVVVTDPDGDTCSISAVSKPAWMTLTDHGNNTATLTGTEPSAEVGTSYSVTLNTDDSNGGTTDYTFNVTVTEVNVVPTGTVTISGTATEGQDLTASNNLADGDGMMNATITYQWSNGKTGSTITLEQADVGSTITVTASYTDDQGNAESVTSSATSEIADENNSPADENNSSSAGIDFYFEGLASTLTLDEEIEFLDVDFQSTLEDIPHVEITLTDPQRIQLNKMFVVELAEDTHIDQATSTLTDEVYESSVTGYQTDETKMPHMGTDLGLATQSLANNGHRVSPTTHGEASVKFMQRNMDTDTIADSFVSDLIHQAILFRFVENELSNEDDLVDEIEDFLEGTETHHLSGILNQKLIDSKTDETQPHSLAYASFHTLVKSITDSANAQQNKRLTNDPINGMFRNANKVGYVDENNQGDDNAYYMEFLAGDHFIFKLTLNPSATPVAPVYANGQVPSQQPRSLYIKLKIE